jgi:NAD(P)-dependent dehydrogenase (short-subunit alcohol dehydrogenase family)
MRMEGRVALVTGAALGYKEGGPTIGGSIAKRLASEGASVVVIDINDEMGERSAETIRAAGGESLYVHADVSKTNEVKAAISATQEKFGALHCLVNCAASYPPEMWKNVVETDERVWHHVIDVNVGGYFRFAKYGIPLIHQSGGGAIVNISSGSAQLVAKEWCTYPVTKAAINALTRTIAVDFAPSIRANAICPGFVGIANSELDRTREEVEAWHAQIATAYPMMRVCSTEEVADVALFLASEDSSYVNGECIVVDGGRAVWERPAV